MQKFRIPFFIGCFTLAASAEAALQFTNVSPSGVASLMGVTCDNNSTFVAVGIRSNIFTLFFDGSGMVSSTATVPGKSSLRAATFGNNTFVVGGTKGASFTSPDGLTWSLSAKVFKNAAIEALAFNPNVNEEGRFVAGSALVDISWSDETTTWPKGVFKTPAASFLEAFTGVVPVGANGYAACGLRGDIRVSSDGGLTWTCAAGHTLKVRQPDLFAIASDGGDQLITVGRGGTNFFSSDAGVTWSPPNRPPPGLRKNLRGVAYDGSEFIAVGMGGTILTTTDGVDLTEENNGLPAGFARDLFAISFATGGNLQGVGMIVGTNGTVLLVGTPPAVPGHVSDAINCANSRPNPAFVASITPDTTHPANTVVVDWYDAPTGGNLVATGNTFAAANDTPATPNSPGIFNYFAEARDLRTGFVSESRTQFTLTINPRPTATVAPNGPTTLCNGQDTTVQATLTGIGPWAVTWSDGFSTNVPANPGNSAVAVRLVSTNNPLADLPTNYTYTVTALTDANCTANSGTNTSDLNGSAVITVNPRPTAAVSGSTTICNSSNTVIQAVLHGIGPWNITWSDGFSQSTNGTAPLVATRLVITNNPLADLPTNYTYTVTALSDANCAANPGDLTGSAVITVNPRPTAAVSGSTTICNSSNAVIQAVLHGIGPWTVTWSDGFVQTTNPPSGSTVVASGLVVTNNPLADVPTNYVYTVAALSDANCTAGPADLTGNAVITVNPRPTSVVSGSATICNSSNTTIQAVLHGIGPWNITWSDGFAQSTNGTAPVVATRLVVTNNPLPDLPTNYTYTITALTDANCTAGPADRTGSAVITVNPRPTSVVSGNTNVCNSSNTVIQALLHGLGPWTVTWSDGFVQTTNTTPGSSVVATRLVVTNNLLSDLPTNYTYTVTALTDANCTSGPADRTGSAVVTVNPRPTSAVSGTTTLCNSSNTTIQALLHGIGPWTVTWSDGFVQTTNATLGNSVVAIRTVVTNNPLSDLPTNYTYTVTALSDANCTAGAADRTGSAVITVNPRPTATVSGTTTICNTSNAVIQALLHGIGPWTVTWSDGFVQTTNTTPGSSVAATRLVVTNNPSHTAPTNYTFTVTALTDSHCTAGAGDLTGNAVITVNPTPLAPASLGNQTGCVGITNPPLRVTLSSGGDTVNWYDAATNLVSSGPTSFVPTNQTAGTFQYFATEVSPFACESTNRTEVDLTLETCTNSLSISLMDTNAVVHWYGNFVLQSTTNLSPAFWLTVTTGTGGTNNSWTNAVTLPPTNNFYRLYAPTN